MMDFRPQRNKDIAMSLEPTISYGTIVQILAMTVGAFVVVIQMRTSLGYQVQRLSAVEEEVHELGKLVVDNARMEERLISLRADLTATNLRITAVETLLRVKHPVT